MKTVSIKFTDEEYEKFQVAADAFKSQGIPLDANAVANFSMQSVKNKTLNQVITDTKAAVKTIAHKVIVPKEKTKKTAPSEPKEG